jgi:hypothetical protein
MKRVEIWKAANVSPILRLCPRIIVFRAFVDQLPKLDVAGSTPVARSLRKPLQRQAISSSRGEDPL